MNTFDQGYLGECLVQAQLARREIRVIKVQDLQFEYDFIASNDARIEVKVANLSKRKDGSSEWRFLNKKTTFVKSLENGNSYKQVRRDRKCDFFVLVCLVSSGEVSMNWERYFIVPKEQVGTTTNISIYQNQQCRWSTWENRWDLISHFGVPDAPRVS